MPSDKIPAVTGRAVTSELGTLTPTQSQYASTDQMANILDAEWIQNAFMIPSSGFSDYWDKRNRYYTTANMKFTDTSLGGAIGINPRPQFCQYSDIPVRGRVKERDPLSVNNFVGNFGMGRQYSEMFDDPAQRIHMCFGVPQFNSLLQFLRAAYESNQVTLARTGRQTGVFYNASKLIGAGALLYAFPLVSVGLFVGKLYNFFTNRPVSRFYNMKPTMHLYWNCVNQLVQAMAVNRGIMPKFIAPEAEQRIGKAYVIDPEFLEGLGTLMPDIFGSVLGGGTTFDVYSVVIRAQRTANQLLKDEYDSLANGNQYDYSTYLNRTMTGAGGHSTPATYDDGTRRIESVIDNFVSLKKPGASIQSFFESMASVVGYKPIEKDQGAMEMDPRSDSEEDGKPKVSADDSKNLGDALDAQIRDGNLFATFIVDHTGPMSESWNNQVAESELAQKLNGIVSGMAETRFTFADGGLIGGLVGDVIGTVANAATDTALGALSGVTGGLSNIMAGLSGGGYIDVPKHWQQSAYQATRANYTMQLVSPYGNPISQMINLDIPLAMLLAGALPRSVGKAAYTAPFLCSLYDRGRCQIRLGMIENLSFVRGTTHLGFSDTGQAMGIDVAFQVVDLSTIMHMPVASGIFNGINMTIDDDNILNDYLAVLTGMSVESQVYDIPRLRAKVAKVIMNASRFTSSAFWSSAFSATPVNEFLTLFTRQTASLDASGISLGN